MRLISIFTIGLAIANNPTIASWFGSNKQGKIRLLKPGQVKLLNRPSFPSRLLILGQVTTESMAR